MKKLYTLASVFLFCSPLFAQNQASLQEANLNHLTSEGEITNSKPHQLNSSRTVLWSEDFEDGLTGWTTSGAQADLWYHAMPLATPVPIPAGWATPATTNPTPSIDYTPHVNGKFPRFYGDVFTTGGQRRIISPSLSNGFAMIDSDSWNNTSGGTFGSLPVDAILTSPVIDLSANEGAVLGVKFNQSVRLCCAAASEMFLEVSTNGFLNFTSYPVFAPQAINAINRTRVIEQNIFSAFSATSDWTNVQIRFRSGESPSHYFWMIDDIEIFTIGGADANLMTAHYAPYWFGNETQRWDEQEFTRFVVSSTTSQNPPIAPVSVVENVGGEVLTNVILTVTITGPGDFAETLISAPATIAITARETLTTTADFIFNNTHPSGEYTLTYTVSSEETDINLANNTRTRTVWLSNWEYGKDLNVRTGAFTNTTGNDNASGNYRIGPSFYMFDDATVYSLGFNLDNASTNGETFEIAVWDANYNGPGGDEYIDGVDVEVTQAMKNNMTYVELDSEIELSEGEGYIVYLTYFQFGHPTNRVFLNLSGTSPGQLNYIRVLDGAANCCFISSVPMIRMNLNSEIVNVERLKEKELFLRAFPNPSSNNFEVQYVLDRDAQVLVELVDITGKVIMNRNEGTRASGIQHNFTIDGSKLTSGMYFYSLIVDGKRHTKKLVKN
ncbi:MAG: T9SS type A sorting domain-containing protein [Luteibaculaceae bacterium]